LDYSFDDRFYADFSLRNDASSRFGSKNRNAQFWSIGGMWNMTNEKFIKNTGFITDAKLKVSYGTQGNSGIGDYTRLALVQSTYAYEDELAWTLSTNPGNDLLTWENQKKFTAGFRAELLKKYRIEFDFYNRTTTDMLMRMTMPLITGFPAVTANVGSLQNRGIDLSLGLDIIRTKDFYVSANVVFNYNVDKVLELYDDLPELRMSASSLEHYVVGQPVMLYYAQYGGVNPETGRQWWYRPGQDRFVTQQNRDSITEVLNDANLRQNSGYRRFSPITGGFGIQVGWKGLSLVADFAFVQGKYMWDATWAQLHSANAMAANAGTVNFSRDVLDYWKQAGDVTEFPDWTQSDQTIGAYADSRSVSNASFMRLKNLALSYSFDKKLLNKTKVFNNARIFVSARNLWTITAYKGIDPEVDNASELNTYMNSKQFQFGIELGF
jgi:hypothetical protein